MSDWVSYTNEKLFLASRLLAGASSEPSSADCLAREQGAILLLTQAYEGLLNELAHVRRLKDRVESLEQLVALAGYSWEWTDELADLKAQQGSWLWVLESQRAALQTNHDGSQSGGIVPQTNLIVSSETEKLDGLGIIQEMKTFLTRLREMNQQY